MTDIFDWLIKLKTSSREFYTKAAKVYSEDAELSRFLETLAHDESIHVDIILKIREILMRSDDKTELTTISQKDRTGYIKEFEDAIARLSSSPFTKDELYETIITLECAEWSDILQAAIRNSKSKTRSLSQAAMSLQKHINYVIRYVEKHHSDRSIFKKLPTPPTFWKEKILVVDNYVHIRSLLKNIYKKKGLIESASDVKTAMSMLDEQYFAAIISETKGKGIDGVEFYKEAVKKFPGMRNRFLFFTSAVNSEQIEFFKKNSIPFLLKPSGLRQLKAAVSEILAKRV